MVTTGASVVDWVARVTVLTPAEVVTVVVVSAGGRLP